MTSGVQPAWGLLLTPGCQRSHQTAAGTGTAEAAAKRPSRQECPFDAWADLNCPAGPSPGRLARRPAVSCHGRGGGSSGELPEEHAAPRGGDEHKGERAGVQGGVRPARSADRRSRGAVRREPEPRAAGPTTSPPQTPDRVHNQALMRILRAPPGPAPRPPRLLLWGRVQGGGVRALRTAASARAAWPRVHRILVKRLRTDTDSCGAHRSSR